MNITPEVIEALTTLKAITKSLHGDRGGSKAAEMAFLVNILDNADVFEEIDQASNELEIEASRINVTIREVPGGWIACQDNDRSRVVAEAILYDELEAALRKLPTPVHVEAIILTGEEG